MKKSKNSGKTTNKFKVGDLILYRDAITETVDLITDIKDGYYFYDILEQDGEILPRNEYFHSGKLEIHKYEALTQLHLKQIWKNELKEVING